jgi:serine phosphatase RsbU (regulator of sigma subunit)
MQAPAGPTRFLFAFLVAALLSLAPAALAAQSVLAISPGQCVWHSGDNPAWAAPSFDDSSWQPYADWKAQPGQVYLWVRCHADLRLLRSVKDPALQVSAYAAYELYLDGEKMGAAGNLKSGNFSMNAVRAFAVPAGRLPVGPSTVALRVTRRSMVANSSPAVTSLDPNAEIRAGDAALLDALRARTVLAQSSRYVEIGIIYGAIVVLAVMLIGAFLYDRSRVELLLLGILCLGLATLRLNDLGIACLLNYSLTTCLWIGFAANVAYVVTATLFFFALARRRVPVLYWALLSANLATLGPWALDLLLGIHEPAWVPSTGRSLFFVFTAVLRIASLSAPFVAFWPWSRIAPRMRVLAALCMVWVLADMAWFVAGAVWALGRVAFFDPKLAAILQSRAIITELVLAALMGLLFREQRQVSKERAILAGEMASAREIQQYLIPEKLPPTPGLAIHSVYQPAREVGGDFFQVLPDARDSSTLIVIGDVAGKGLRAGMLAALIVGAIRTAFQFTPDPSRILSLLNERLQGRGLVTCLAMRVDRDGRAEIANAGHLPPYVNGKELALDGALPLGAFPSASFPVTRLQLREGESLLLLSDGVVEARNPSGELFGFDRAAAISTESAETIARAASTFGQEDDITVLTLALLPAGAPHA